jgi:hypothetical protein
MFFLPLDLRFHTGTCLRPLIHRVLSLFISSFLLKLLILLLEPHCFQSLFNVVISRVVIEIIRTTFKPVLRNKLNFLWLISWHIYSVECTEGLGFYGSFRLFEIGNRGASQWSVSKSALIRSACLRLVINAPHISKVKAFFIIFTHPYLFLIETFLFSLFDFFDLFFIAAYLFALEILNSDICRWNCWVNRTLWGNPRWILEHLFIILCCFILVYKALKHFVLDHFSHASSHGSSCRVKQLKISFNVNFR